MNLEPLFAGIPHDSIPRRGGGEPDSAASVFGMMQHSLQKRGKFVPVNMIYEE